MAAVVVAFDGNRVNASDVATNWGNYVIGGGAPASENQNAYQGTAVNKKITSTTARQGVDYDPGASPENMWLATRRLWFFKGVVADAFDLDPTFGSEAVIGSGNAAFHIFATSGTNANRSVYDVWPPQGGYLITAIDPRLAYAVESTTGTPDLTAVDYWAFGAMFTTGAAKNENVALDAIDVGRGLILTRGDAGSTEGVWQDFVDADQGTDSATAPGRVGVCTSPGPGLLIGHGIFTIGDSAGTNPTEFLQDTAYSVVFADGYHSAGSVGTWYYCRNASDVHVDVAQFSAQGSKDANQDTRYDVAVFGTAGSLDIDGKTLLAPRRVLLNNAVTAVGLTVSDGGQVDPTNADYSGSTALDGTGDYYDTAAAVSHTFANGDFTIVWRGNATDWTTATRRTLFHWDEAGADSILLELDASDDLSLAVEAGGATTTVTDTTILDNFVDTYDVWLKVFWDASAGQADFYYSLDHENTPPQDIVWIAGASPTGTSRTIATLNGSAYIGGDSTPGGNLLTGDVAYCSIWDGLETTGGLQVMLMDFRTGADFVGGPPGTRADGIQTVNWREQGNPVYTQGDDNTTAADLDGAAISGSDSYAALRWDVNADPNGELDNITFVKGTPTAHAIEFGKNSPASVTLTGPTFTGYNAANGNADSTFYNNTGGALTINLTSPTGNTTYRNGVGASTTVSQSVNVTITVTDVRGDPIEGARVRVEEDEAPPRTLISNGNTNASGVYTFSFTGTTPQAVRVVVRLRGYKPPPVVSTSITSTGLDLPVVMTDDPIVNMP